MFISAAILTTLGFAALETVLQSSPARTTAHIGRMSYFFGSVLLVVAECLYMRSHVPEDPLIVAYVVLALLSQGVIGAALVQSNLLPAWIGWTTIAWNFSGFILLVVLTFGNHYIPIFHHFMPLLIGIPLLWRG